MPPRLSRDDDLPQPVGRVYNLVERPPRITPIREDRRLSRGAVEKSRRYEELNADRLAREPLVSGVRCCVESAISRDRPDGGFVLIVTFVLHREVEGGERVHGPVKKPGWGAVMLGPHRDLMLTGAC
jgi:hypothetical protein